jgi:His-Xaa-Ser system radical SAM maturase HxsC
MLGIPLYADYYQVHDHVVQVKGAFNQTVRGLYNLARHGQRIEIRVVLHQLTVPRLTRLAQYIFKNLPFVEHIAFMGLENTGYTPFHLDQLWIDPVHYQEPLEEAVLHLAHLGMSVSIYNTQLCVLPGSLWPFVRKSISDWKNIYLEECQGCTKVEACGGLFASSATKGRSAYLKAFI